MKQDFKNLRHTFWAHEYRSTMKQKLVQNFLQKEAGAFGSNIGKEPQKPRPKLKYMYYIYWEYLLCLHFEGTTKCSRGGGLEVTANGFPRNGII